MEIFPMFPSIESFENLLFGPVLVIKQIITVFKWIKILKILGFQPHF